MKCKLLIACLTLLLLSGCVKDESDFIKGPDGKTYTSSILGIVLDEDGNPIKDVQVAFDGVNKLTDENGVYLFNNVEVSDQHSYIKLKKAGYFDGSRAFITARKASIQLKNILLRKNFDKNFDSKNGGTLKESNITLDFPTDAIVIESTGEKYSGQVNVAIKYLDPTSETIYDEMPGNLTGLNTAQAEVVLTTYGMVAIEMQGSAGQKLQIASGKKVKISNKVPVALLSKAPSSIPLWYFDEVLGYWREEGEAQLISDSYLGEVSHFSSWNYDIEDPSIILSGLIVDDKGNPMSGVKVIVNIGGIDSYVAFTNTDGSFSGRIKKGTAVSLFVKSTVISYGCNVDEILFSADLGVLNTDIDLGNIIANSALINNYEIKGKFINCSGAPVQSGFIKFAPASMDDPVWFFPIINGEFKGNILSCLNPLNLTYSAIDLIEVTRTEDSNLILTDHSDLEEIIVCDSEAEYISVSNTEHSFVDTIFPGLINHIAELSFVDISALTGSKTENGNMVLEISLGWEDYFNNGNFNTGSFDLFFANSVDKNIINFQDDHGIKQKYKLDSGTINIIKGGGSGKLIEGNFTLEMINSQTFLHSIFTGKFRILNN